MKKEITKKEFEIAEKRMNELLAIATKKGGFKHLTKKESTELDKHTQIVNAYEEKHYTIPLPETLQGLIELKMYENKLKQKELAKMLNTTDTKLSEIMHKKRKPSISFLKAMHQILGIDGNLLLELA
jgi:HTH-type transcriptional regulator/antitoxin HigA